MKSYGFNVNPEMIQYNSSIRSKYHILQILMAITRYLLISKPQSISEIEKEIPPDKIRLVVYIDKMSRIFLSEKDKIHSFYFPFTLTVHDEKYVISFKNDIEITNVTCTVFESVFYSLSESDTMEDILEYYWDIVSDLQISKEETALYGRLLAYLLSFEPGYLRFDHDTARKNGSMHPEDHFDINYTDGASFKFGLSKPLDDVSFIDIIDTTSPCRYLSLKK